jgi:hypothetical protein
MHGSGTAVFDVCVCLVLQALRKLALPESALQGRAKMRP